MEYTTWTESLRATAAWIVQMSRHPGWVDHARHRTRELLADPMNAGLLEMIREEMSKSSSPSEPSAHSIPASTGGHGPGA